YILFAAEVKKAKVKIAKEHNGFKWLPYQKASELLTWPNQKKCLKIVNNYLKRFKNISKHR
ncbi:MAG: hypothetical protein N3G19_02530, partial [Candidatus Pacearchaeota archaeon]|nr:hypothetical protein [Candidatus Pacearchaeota archaeon]